MRPEPDFRVLFEHSPGLYLVLAPDPPRFTIVAVSAAYLAATMTTREAILGKGIFEVFPDNPDDPAASGVANLRASLDRVVVTRGADTMAIQKYDIRRPEEEGSGFEERYWSPKNSPICVDGELRYVVHRVEDVTAMVRLKQADQVHERQAANERARAEQMELELYARATELQEANRQLRELHQQLELRVEERTAELRATEEQLRQAQKLEAIGRLAGGVAHDFNNLLTVVLGHTEVLLGELNPDDPRAADLEQVKLAGERAAQLTHQLLAFSRRQVVDPEVLSINQVLQRLQSMIRSLVGEDVEIKMLLASSLGAVRADRSQIEQVVMNLVVNARDALPLGGKLTIETADVVLDEAYADQHVGVTPGPYVLLAVSDNGVGMDKATQSRVFEPFFTTKDRGKGTGLGLSTVFGIVKQCGGHIWLYSELAGGTTFKLYLPRHEGVPAAADAAVRTPLATGHETILLVEDEDQVRQIGRLILERAGYRVLDANGPEEALRIAERERSAIDLLLTDVIMPVMNGREVAARVRELLPDVRVVFTSGYTDDVVLHHGVLDSGVAFIEKPLTAERLTQKVREVLDARR